MNMKKLNEFMYDGGYVTITAFIYVLIGVIFRIWHPTWLLFLTIPVYYMWEEFKVSRDWCEFPYPILCVILYLAVGFDYGLWHPMWVIFITVPIYYLAVESFQHT